MLGIGKIPMAIRIRNIFVSFVRIDSGLHAPRSPVQQGYGAVLTLPAHSLLHRPVAGEMLNTR